jgi:hypothetical protein
VAEALAPPTLLERGRQQELNLILERSLLSDLNAKRREGAYLLNRKEGVSFVSKEEVSDDISFFVF